VGPVFSEETTSDHEMKPIPTLLYEELTEEDKMLEVLYN
jgi:hypothetical protein